MIQFTTGFQRKNCVVKVGDDVLCRKYPTV